MRTNQASGGVSRAMARIHGRRHSAAEMRAPTPRDMVRSPTSVATRSC